MDWPSFKILLPADVLATLVFVLLVGSSRTNRYTASVTLLTGLAALLLLPRLPATFQEIVFLLGLVMLVAYLAKPYINQAKDPYIRNVRWLLTFVFTLSLALAADGWLYR